jgi:N-acetylmuramoyl-L-alanine amidase
MRAINKIIVHCSATREGQDISIGRSGAHTIGENKNSIGICYIGGVEEDGKTPKDTRTEEQKRSLTNLLITLKSIYGDDVKIHGHRDFAAKACPSFDATSEYKYI